MDKLNPIPVEIRAPRGADNVDIVWDDGQTTRLNHRLLRGYCPCANCQGHEGTLKFVEGDSSELKEIEEVGDYALRFVWPDCGTGIYTFPHLRRLADLDVQDIKLGDPLARA